MLGQCSLCNSIQISYHNALLSMRVPGIQVELCLCDKHAPIVRHPNRWSKINRDLWTETSQELVRLEENYFKGKELPEETCFLCLGSGELESQGQCWWCKGEGIVKPEPLPVWMKLLQGVSP